jgi:hypothetical protein
MQLRKYHEKRPTCRTGLVDGAERGIFMHPQVFDEVELSTEGARDYESPWRIRTFMHTSSGHVKIIMNVIPHDAVIEVTQELEEFFGLQECRYVLTSKGKRFEPFQTIMTYLKDEDSFSIQPLMRGGGKRARTTADGYGGMDKEARLAALRENIVTQVMLAESRAFRTAETDAVLHYIRSIDESLMQSPEATVHGLFAKAGVDKLKSLRSHLDATNVDTRYTQLTKH